MNKKAFLDKSNNSYKQLGISKEPADMGRWNED